MNTPSSASDYRILDAAGVIDLIGKFAALGQRLGGTAGQWQVREVGDGNLNLVFLVDGPQGSLCVKQAVPYVRVAGPSWPMSLERAYYEHSYYEAVAPFVGGLIPAVLHYDAQLYCLVMECLSPHVILRHGLIAGRRYDNLARDIGTYVANACFHTSDLGCKFETKMNGVARFARNQGLLRITVDLVFIDPYRHSERNRHTSPQLDAIAAEFRGDAALKIAASRCAEKFLSSTQALVHGDLHSGSVMVTEHDARVIDPEFAFYGPIGFDLGAFVGNLLLSWYSQPGHADLENDRKSYQSWILDQVRLFWHVFHRRFLELWVQNPNGDAFSPLLFSEAADAAELAAARAAYLDSLFTDMLAFAACKMIRRILGFAHVIDFEWIKDPALRARCEAGALNLARRLLTHPGEFRSIDDVVAVVPRMASPA